MKKILAGMIILLVAALLLGCTAKETKTTVKKTEQGPAAEEAADEASEANSEGEIKLEIKEQEDGQAPEEETAPSDAEEDSLGISQEDLD